MGLIPQVKESVRLTEAQYRRWDETMVGFYGSNPKD
jgi:hypothetical protein